MKASLAAFWKEYLFFFLKFNQTNDAVQLSDFLFTKFICRNQQIFYIFKRVSFEFFLTLALKNLEKEIENQSKKHENQRESHNDYL